MPDHLVMVSILGSYKYSERGDECGGSRLCPAAAVKPADVCFFARIFGRGVGRNRPLWCLFLIIEMKLIVNSESLLHNPLLQCKNGMLRVQVISGSATLLRSRFATERLAVWTWLSFLPDVNSFQHTGSGYFHFMCEIMIYTWIFRK